MFSDSKLEDFRKEINAFVKERDWEKARDPKNLALSLLLEASEVLELFQWTQDNQIQKGKEADLADELADVLSYTIALADAYKIDLIQAFEKKMQKNKEKYPIEKAKGNTAKYNEL